MPQIYNIGGQNNGAFGFGGGLGNDTFSDAGGAVSDLFAAKGDRLKAQGDRLEGENYDRAAVLADQNAQFTETSTNIKEAQQQRDLYKSLGETQADIGGAGFEASGSGLDILRESAQQGALTHQVISQQGLITEAGYKEQAQSYRTMSQAAGIAADAEENAAKGATITAGIKGAAALATLA